MKTKFENKYYDNNLFSEKDEREIIRTVQEFSRDNDKLLNKKYIKFQTIGNLDEEISKSISSKLNQVCLPKPGTTYPDELTSIVLETAYEHPPERRKEIIDYYANQKQAEMYIGALLELYIQKFGLKFGWCFCGDVIRSIDFVKKIGHEWYTYQIKKSDNTENSSASKVRVGTNIYKWARRKSTKKNTFYWDTFPDVRLKNSLSEEGFRQFVKEYYKNITEYEY